MSHVSYGGINYVEKWILSVVCKQSYLVALQLNHMLARTL